MLALALVPVLGALAATAQITPRHMALFPRQLDASTIPAACTSSCNVVIPIYQACTTGNTNGCLAVCEQSNFSGFIDCFNCVEAQEAGGVPASLQAQLDSAIDELKDACASAGSTVTGSLSNAVPATGSASATGSDAGLLSSIADFTTAVSGTTIAAGGTSVTSRVISAVSSAAPTAASSAAPAAGTTAAGTAPAASSAPATPASSASAASGASPVVQKALGGVVAVIGVVGGAMMML
ncbi:hypothetical protein CI109_106720 [Kwoniella shandongensis]|uniref:Uncharacterized protein n=1 Tax=Kwoniella shandongensis TaxID=1734106 RepID=A0A5M6C6U6_9TREE|nr:uncharacterized protein CI109_001024 [Kwoniella shandongensis]KAA5530844.1 hypothetical protein CI109_001024 [Kwoniella shandongensis]